MHSLDVRRIADRVSLVSTLADDIERSTFQAHYRKEPVGHPVRGWGKRLQSYFWPKQCCDYSWTVKKLEPLIAEGRMVADAHHPWNINAKKQALTFAEGVFSWGNVRQKNLTSDKIEAVVQAALYNRLDGAPMNSGWTKLAAFITAHLEGENRSQAIFDSRVSWSLVRRMDRILAQAGYFDIPVWLNSIGKIPGRGGTRWSTQLRLPWPYVYGRWDAHFAASALVRELRDELNRHGLSAPQPDGTTAPWTMRTVEMVLFMDGY